MGRLLLLDTASLYFRAFHGLPDSLRAPDGRSVNAVRGLLDFIAYFVSTYSPAELACCWDNSWRPAWRVALVPSYKAHRVDHGDVEKVPEALVAQVPLIREVLAAAGLPVVGADGFEADDVIATLARAATGGADIATGDRDLFQLVDDAAGVRVLYCGRGVAKHDRVDAAWLAAKYGVAPEQYVDFAVLRGDPSDGLPGVPGIGEKTAAGLLARHGDLEGVLAAAGAGGLAPTVTRRLAEAVDYLAAARTVVATEDRVPLPPVDLTLPAAPGPEFAALAAGLGLGGSADRLVEALVQAGRST